MPGLIRRSLLIGGAAAALGGVALWRWQKPGATELAYDSCLLYTSPSPRD